MPSAAIPDEMRPKGVIRSINQELAEKAGEYIMVSWP